MRLIVWDFDGTLAFREGMWTGTLCDVLAVHAPHLLAGREALRAQLQSGFPWHQPELGHLHLSSADLWWSSLSPLFVRAFRAAGAGPELAESFAREVRSGYCDPSRWKVFPDTIAALSSLADLGWTHAVLSNHVPELEQIIASLGLSKFFRRVVCSAVLGYEKPHPIAYSAVTSGMEPPEDVWMVGDSFEADYTGAERFGWRSILVRKAHPQAARFSEDLGGIVTIMKTATRYSHRRQAAVADLKRLSSHILTMTPAVSPYSQAMLDYWRGDVSAAYTIHREDGYSHTVPVAGAFATPPFSPLEQLAVSRCSGRVLDIGAGVGRHTLALQERGCVVTGLEMEPELAGIMSERGVTEARAGDVFALASRKFDTLLMLMNGFGLVGTPSGAAAFLEHARNLLSPRGQILCDSLDVRQTANPVHIAYQETNLSRGLPAGQMRFWIEYRGKRGQTFDWLHMDFDSLQNLAHEHGVSAEMLACEESGHYLARLVHDDVWKAEL
ncbi:MAG TPA: HAD-IA family hydrolase [Opitutaceae bacterium]|nr:HAD-IA family hydrolase [Opitutaceae bacterium]